jgi:hypothetical protein
MNIDITEEHGQWMWCQVALQNFIPLQLMTFQSSMCQHSKIHEHIP